ncbi:glycosyl hydrolase [Listeria newyorkensis]|uniref:Glycosyl hydrolase n=1 Tax=Listeria newyorkensis TaxID=1497681 RepID=A0ABX4XJT2_9LIST|nr:glycoside hydrolase family 38 C-terminal domain-containing protein [Listeria newyorkensis]KGL45585.1 glycosyl hydrolase [Listeria newyorkensis]PNP89373.1 glycosyl hydrolase [Listeria newyorkensis]WAO22945.1 glycoside hydrolase family 38 C-terminal domain-containing protein [Listeria newyorkensis]SQC57239.1 Mannosylglycerate hydrolase [Listeria newyorkensis]
MVKAHIVNHTHWDREWYFTSADALVLSEQLFTEVIEELQAHPEANFVLDGQLSILDDYVALYPEKMDDIKKLIADKQLFIGPWFTQTDAFFAHGESILRNAMIGIFDSKKYGDYMEIGYLPDTFGFNAQMPTLLSQAGFDNIIFWRGIHLGEHVQSTYFKWSGLGDAAQIYAINMPQGYGTGMLLEPTTAYVDGRLDPAIDFIAKYSATQEVLIPSGNDQLNIITNFAEKLAEINKMGRHSYELSTYQDFIAYAKTLPDLEEYRGEFRSPVLARVHKTIGSSRMNIKLKSAELEQKLLTRIEPLLVIAKASGIPISERLLMHTWKKLLEGQAHDSLAGCVSDPVAEDIMHRMKEADELCDSIENTIVKKIADDLQLEANEILVFNTELAAFDGYKEIQVVTKNKQIHFPDYPDATIIKERYIEPRENVLEETPAGNRFIEEPGYYVLQVRVRIQLPGLGYRVIAFESCDVELESTVAADETVIQNESYTICFENGQIRLETTKGARKTAFIELEDTANAGDTYDYSPLDGDVTRYFQFEKATTEKSSQVERLILTGTNRFPLDLEDRLTNAKQGEIFAKMVLELRNRSELVTCDLEVDNQIRSHRLRLKVNTDVETTSNIASLPFGFIERKPGVPANWQEIYSEMPIDVEPFEQSVTLTNDTESCTVFTCGIKEYQQFGSNIALTLLATTDQLGKPDLAYRPGRASGDTTKKGHVLIPTEGAQLIGTHHFFLAIHLGDSFDERETASRSREWSQANVSYQRQPYNHFLHRLDNKIQKTERNRGLQRTLELINLPKEYLVSACYPSYYDATKYMIRLENPTNTPQKLDLSRIAENGRLEIVNALEEVIQNSDAIISAYDAVTLRLDM